MPFWVLLLLIVGITAAMFAVLHPLRLLRAREFWVSHLGMWLGLWLIWGFVVLRSPNADLKDVTILIGGLWTLGGGVCYAVLHVSRRLMPVGKGTPEV